MPKKKKPGQITAKGDKAPRAADPRVQLSAESEARIRDMLKTVSVQSYSPYWLSIWASEVPHAHSNSTSRGLNRSSNNGLSSKIRFGFSTDNNAHVPLTSCRTQGEDDSSTTGQTLTRKKAEEKLRGLYESLHRMGFQRDHIEDALRATSAQNTVPLTPPNDSDRKLLLRFWEDRFGSISSSRTSPHWGPRRHDARVYATTQITTDIIPTSFTTRTLDRRPHSEIPREIAAPAPPLWATSGSSEEQRRT
eukprot:1190821-Prorocentrum_minimum.AAC.1